MIQFRIILFSLLFFLFFFIIHIIIWRILKPKKHISSILFLFVFFPSCMLLIFFFINYFLKFSIISNLELLLIYILYIGISGVYIQTYPAIQAWSPSLYIVYLIGVSKNAISKDQIKETINRDILINERFGDLINEGFIKISKLDNSIVLSKKGKILSSFFIFYREILGLKEGQG